MIRFISLRRTELRAILFGTIIPSRAIPRVEDLAEIRNGPERNTESANFSTHSYSDALDSRLLLSKLFRRSTRRTFNS